MINSRKKRIKITNKGYVLTSRGMARTPIDRPYMESVDTILLLITRFNATVVEVLDNGDEIELTMNNYAKDNNVTPTTDVNPSVEPQKTINPVVNPEQPTNSAVNEESQNPTFISKNMSRKERKRLEAEKRREAQENNINTEEHTNIEEDGGSTEESVGQLDDIVVE